jgi:hypothetical protein
MTDTRPTTLTNRGGHMTITTRPRWSLGAWVRKAKPLTAASGASSVMAEA